MESKAAPVRGEAALIAGRYRVEGLLGEGGMGVVFAVVDEPSAAALALKRLSASASPAAVAMFQREYHTLVQLRHPCIVRALDYGVDATGPYYTMERLGGEDLRKVGPLPWRESCRVLGDLASALGLLHSRRLLHRDVNHKNARYVEGQRTRLLDFGALASFGVAAERVGMAAFMSPEAYHGQPLGPQSDLFALGGVAYWLLTGRLAYDAHSTSELPALWRRAVPSPAVLGVPLPSALDALVMQLLSLHALARPASAAEVMDRLSEIAELEPGDPQQAARSYLANPRLVGRARELERLDRVLRLGLQAKPAGQPSSVRTGGFMPVDVRGTSRIRRGALPRGRGTSDRLLWVSGEAGLGRSRLLHELALQAKLRGARVAWVSAGALSGRPHSALRGLLDALVGQEPELLELLEPEQRGALEPLLPGPSRRSDAPTAARGAPGGDKRRTVHAAVVQWLLRAAQARGLVLVVDDAHRLDEHTAAFVAELAGRLESGRVVLALSSSGVQGAPSRALESAYERATKLELTGLDASAVEELIASVFGQATYSRRLAAWIHRVSEGNPLHCMQLVGHLVDAGLARYEHGGWKLPTNPPVDALPDGLKDVYAARVAALSPAAHSLGHVLALHDLPVELECMERLAGGLSGSALYAALSELTDAGVVDSDGKGYRLAHRPIADALCGTLGAAQRRAIHLQLVHALQADEASDLRGRFEVAYHLLHGGADEQALSAIAALARNTDLVPTIGPRAGQLFERALALWEGDALASGDVVRMRLALVISASVYDSTLLHHAGSALAELREASGVARAAAMDPALPASERMRAALAEQASERQEGAALHPAEALGLLSTLVLYLVYTHATRADVASIERLLDTTELVAGLGGVPALVHDNVLAAVDNLSGYGQRARERFARVIEGLDQAIAATGPGAASAPLRRWRSTLYSVLGSATLYSNPDESLGWADRAEQAGAAVAAWRLRYLAGLLQLDAGAVERADEQLDALVPVSLSRADHGGWFVMLHGSIQFMAADLGALRATLDMLETMMQESPGYGIWRELNRGYLAVLRGEFEAAERAFRAALACEPTGQVAAARHATVELARLLSAAGRHSEALSLCDALAQGVPGAEVSGFERNGYLGARARALGGLGRAAAARELMERALSEAQGCSALMHFDRLCDAAMLGLLLRDDAMVQRAARAAAELSRASGMPGLTKRYAALQKSAQLAGQRLSSPPV